MQGRRCRGAALACCARRKTTARDLQLQQRQLACDAPPPPHSLPCVAAPTPECRCCTCPRTAAPLPSPPCPAVPPAHPACTPVPPCPIKRSSRSFICAPKTAVLRHCCSMRAMSAWPASAAMSAAVLLSLQRALRGRRGQGDGVGWRGGGGGRVEEGACGRWRGGEGEGARTKTWLRRRRPPQAATPRLWRGPCELQSSVGC